MSLCLIEVNSANLLIVIVLSLQVFRTSHNFWVQYEKYVLNPKSLKGLSGVATFCSFFDNKYFIPIVCFSNQAKLKIKAKSIVVPLDYLVSTIKSYQNIILDSNLQEIYNRIIEVNIINKSERKNHVKNIRNKISEDNSKVDNMICPKCGGNLVVRNGKYGSFIGCSNYPKCKFTKKR